MKKSVMFVVLATVASVANQAEAQVSKYWNQAGDYATQRLPQFGTKESGSFTPSVLPSPKPQPAPIKYNNTNIGTARGGTLYQSNQGQKTVVYPQTNSARPAPNSVYRPPNTTQIYTKTPGTQYNIPNTRPINQNPNYTPLRNVQPQVQQSPTARGAAATSNQSGINLYNKVYGNGGMSGGTARGR